MAVDDPDVVARVDRDADRRAEHPVVRQRLRPERIDLEARRDAGGAEFGGGSGGRRGVPAAVAAPPAAGGVALLQAASSAPQ